MRIAVVEALGRIGGNRAVEILAPHMNEADVSVRQSVANVLGRIGGNRAVEILEASATDEDEAVRRIALAGLRANQGLVRDPTTRARFAVEKKAWDKVAQMGQAAIGPLQDYFDSGGDGPGAVEALTNIGGPEVPAMLVSLLTRRDFYWEARTALIRLRERAVDALFAGLDSNNDQTRSYSGQILGEIGDRRTLGRLIAAMADEEVLRRIDPDWKTSEEARQAIPTLAGLAAVKGGRNALEAGWRLVYIGRATQTAEPFIAALRCKEFDFNSECSPRGIAIGDMRGLRDAQAFGPLLDFIDDPAYAATILGFLTEILKCSAAEIASAILQKAASLPDVLHSVHVGDTYIPDTSTTGWTRSDYEDRPLDCSSLRKLACDELNRRKT
ncbi:MAG TPA: HEAT repeat domain-containing protein [Pirellulaceae bacterium]|nr:HEAT repeat domain-containing protein [Pirellulaceae bacterium]